MSQIVVNPDSIRQYANAAQGQFDAIRVELQNLVDEAVNVRYFGPNAVDFKTKCGQMAAEFGQRMAQDLAQIADAVRVSTTNISSSLGGNPVSVSVNGAPIPVPSVPQGDGTVELDTSNLEALKPSVTRRISAIGTQLDTHLRNLQNTVWQGQAKESAVSTVSTFTNAAKNRAAEAERNINKYVDDQVASTLASDK